MLTVQSLTRIFANARDGIAGGVRDASFSLSNGCFFSLLGPSGCGKTTTLRCVAGLETPDQGHIAIGSKIVFDGAHRAAVPVNERNIGMVFQSYAIWPHMTVFDNVAFPLRVARRFGGAEITQRVREALKVVELEGFDTRSATRLSGGQQQRVALARAIVRRPELLLLDEPLSNLDAALRAEMRKELKRLQRQLGLTAVYVTHDQEEALAMSDLIAVIDHGRIVQIGTPREIYFQPATAFVARFVGGANVLRASVVVGAAQGKEGAVRLADGTVVRGRFATTMREGDAATIAVRPEALRLDRNGATGDNLIKGVVRTASFQGAVSRYEIACGETTLHASVAGRADLAPGDQVTLSVAAADVSVLPPEPG